MTWLKQKIYPEQQSFTIWLNKSMKNIKKSKGGDMETLLSIQNIGTDKVIIKCWNKVTSVVSIEKNKRIITKIIKNFLRLQLKTIMRRINEKAN